MKKSDRKKISIFYFLIFLILTSLVLVIYISNIIYINEIALINNNLKEEINKNIQTNSQLRIEQERLSSFERISKLAKDKFGISYKENAIDNSKLIIIKQSDLR